MTEKVGYGVLGDISGQSLGDHAYNRTSHVLA
jgi:hypothetical protein